MQANDFGSSSLVKVAADSIAHLLTKAIESIRLGKNGFAQGACGKSTFGGLFDQKDEFVHLDFGSRTLTFLRISAILRFFSRRLSRSSQRSHCVGGSLRAKLGYPVFKLRTSYFLDSGHTNGKCLETIIRCISLDSYV